MEHFSIPKILKQLPVEFSSNSSPECPTDILEVLNFIKPHDQQNQEYKSILQSISEIEKAFHIQFPQGEKNSNSF